MKKISQRKTGILIINIIFMRKQEKSDYSKKKNKKSNNQTI